MGESDHGRAKGNSTYSGMEGATMVVLSCFSQTPQLGRISGLTRTISDGLCTTFEQLAQRETSKGDHCRLGRRNELVVLQL